MKSLSKFQRMVALPLALSSTSIISLLLVPLSVRWVSDLNFGQVIQGDGPMTVPPQTSENGSNASFEVVGEPRTAYTIILPQSVSLKSATATLSVTGFQSRPQAGANGKLNRKGVETVYVGATLGAVGFQHPSGKYFGTFLATVVY